MKWGGWSGSTGLRRRTKKRNWSVGSSNSAYISRLNTMQSFNSVDFLRGIVEEDAGGGKAEGEGERKLRQPGQQPFRVQGRPGLHGKRFFLNGVKCKLIGLNRHQSWPYVGYAMPERIQRRDAQLLRRELGCNVVRTSHYPQSRHFLDACDELGLLVMEEIPGWLARYNREISGLIGMVIKSAGGWGETENNLVLEGWLGDRIVCRKEVG